MCILLWFSLYIMVPLQRIASETLVMAIPRRRHRAELGLGDWPGERPAWIPATHSVCLLSEKIRRNICKQVVKRGRILHAPLAFPQHEIRGPPSTSRRPAGPAPLLVFDQICHVPSSNACSPWPTWCPKRKICMNSSVSRLQTKLLAFK